MSIDLVTGGAGFIGSHLVDRLIALGRRVRVIDNFASGHRRNFAQHAESAALEIVEGDITDAATMRAAADGVERVFHVAALADIVPSIQNPEAYFRANVDGTFATLQAARAADVRRFVYVASSSCYGIPDAYPTAEDAEIRPQYPYALTKWLGECLVMHWAQVYRLPALSLRFFNIYGPRARTSGTYGAVFGVFLAQMLAGKPLTIVGDGTQRRDFTYVSDAVEALLAAARSDRVGRCYNVGSDHPVSVNRLVELLAARETVHIPKRPGEPDCTFADTRRVKAELGWSAKVPIEDGISRMLAAIEYWRDAPVWTPASIAAATADWFKYLGNRQ
ncbi:MAG TPA: SDR family oxidoreductase [Xanthobacteraceae bacterium]|nr:SDR family oxidoreductase [Xanthobacteraceae bacterium]